MNPLLSSILLIAGTSIGAAMLALPVSTAAFGFLPAGCVFLLSWFVMLLAALLMLEVNLRFDGKSNIVSMAGHTLGHPGRMIAWVVYSLLLYALMAAYMSGISDLIYTACHTAFGLEPPRWSIAATLVTWFGLIIFLGSNVIDGINRLLMLILVAMFIGLAVMLMPHIEVHRLNFANFKGLSATLPMIITAFGFHIVIPSLRQYLGNDRKRLIKAILIGASLPLTAYLLWELMIYGVVPRAGQHGLLAMLVSGRPIVDLTLALRTQLNSHGLVICLEFFLFCIIATSFIGVSMSLFDFLTDGLNRNNSLVDRIFVVMLTFIPPALFALYYPKGFMVALGYAGSLVAILLCLMPVAMAYVGRRADIGRISYHTPGGRLTLLIVCIYGVAVILAELIQHFV